MKILETFAGIGSQKMALLDKKNNLKITKSFISEWYIEAILAYKEIHFPNLKLDIKPTSEQMIKQFNSLGLSKDSKKPHFFSEKDIKRSKNKYESLYKANIIINNKGSIINEKKWNYNGLNQLDLLTYSFPCQDLSTAGNMKGLSRESGTKSSLLWKIKDLIKHLKSMEYILPKVLLMENVSVISSKRYAEGLEKFENYLKDFGYKNFSIHLNSSEFGSSQNRRRFFLISIRKDLLQSNINLPELIKEFYFENKIKKNKLRSIISDIKILPKSSKNDIYEKQLQGWYDNGKLNTDQKIQNANLAYPSFNQAKVLIGLDYHTTPTITFQGEFSKIRFFDVINKKVIVRRANSLVNWKLMGFEKKHHTKLIHAGFKDNIISSLAGNSITLNQLINIFGAIKKLGVWDE